MGEHMTSRSLLPPLRVGVIGTGAMGASHVSMLAAWVPNVVVSVVSDVDERRATAVATEVGADFVPDAAQLIASDAVDAVVVSSPDPTHEELVLACLAARKPVLCEKPLALDGAGSQRVVDAEAVLGRRFVQVGFMRRYDPAFEQLRGAVRSGVVGVPRVVHCVHRNARAHPSASSEGIVVNSMIHELDCVPWILDDPLVAITVLSPRRAEAELRDPQVAVLETAGGVLVTVEVFVNARYGYDVTCEVVGDEGTVRLTQPYGLAQRRDGVDGALVSSDFVARFADAYRIELAGWVRAARSGTVCGPSSWDGHLANLVAAAGVESLRTGRRVAVEQTDAPEHYR